MSSGVEVLGVMVDVIVHERTDEVVAVVVSLQDENVLHQATDVNTHPTA